MATELEPVVLVSPPIDLSIENGVSLSFAALKRHLEHMGQPFLWCTTDGEVMTQGLARRFQAPRKAVLHAFASGAPGFMLKGLPRSAPNSLLGLAQEIGVSKHHGLVIGFLISSAHLAASVPARRRLLLLQDEPRNIARLRLPLLSGARWLKERLTLLQLAAASRHIYRYFDNIVVVSESERSLMPAQAKGKTTVIPNGIEVPDSIERVVGPMTQNVPPRMIVFSDFRSPRNRAGATRVLERIFPRVRAARGDVQLDIIGRDATTISNDVPSGAHLAEYVEDLAPRLLGADVALAVQPMASGIKNSVLLSSAFGVPTVVSTAVAATLPEPIRSVSWVVDTDDQAVDAVLEVLSTEAAEVLRSSIHAATRAHGGWAEYSDRVLAAAAGED